jgi:hypothetical protein
MSSSSRSRTKPVSPPRPNDAKARRDDYRRERDLPRLVPLLSEDLSVSNRERHRALLALLRRALRAERRRAKAGDWSYDLGRHAALLAAYRHELDLWRRSAQPARFARATADDANQD